MTAPAIRATTPFARPLLMSLYVLAFAFALPALLEFLLVSFPYRFGTAQWRFGAVGLLFNNVTFSPLVGLTLALFAAVHLGHRRTARTLAVIAFVVAALLAIAAPFFVLDFLQLRASVNPQMKRAFDYTSAKAALTGAIMFASAAAVGLGGWRSVPPAAPRAARVPGRAATTVMVGGSAPEAPRA